MLVIQLDMTEIWRKLEFMNDPHRAIGLINELLQNIDPESPERIGNYAGIMALLAELERHVNDSESQMKNYDRGMISRLRSDITVFFGFDAPEKNTSPDVFNRIYETLGKLKTGVY